MWNMENGFGICCKYMNASLYSLLRILTDGPAQKKPVTNTVTCVLFECKNKDELRVDLLLLQWSEQSQEECAEITTLRGISHSR